MAILPPNPNEELPNNESENQPNANQDKVSNEGNTSDGVEQPAEGEDNNDSMANESVSEEPTVSDGETESGAIPTGNIEEQDSEAVLAGSTTHDFEQSGEVIADSETLMTNDLGDEPPVPEIEKPVFKRYLLDFAGRGNDYFFIAFRGYALTVLTLGLYYPWARVQRMRYMLNNLWLDGSPFVFEATGKEVFKGFIKVYAILAGLAAVYLYALISKNFILQSLMPLIFSVLGFLITPLAVHGSLRYRTSKTSWKGIYFHYTGSLEQLYGLYLKNILLIIVTIGIYGTWAQVNLLRYLAENLKLGNIELKYKADGTKIFVRSFVTGLIAYGAGMALMMICGIFLFASGSFKVGQAPDPSNATAFLTTFLTIYFALLVSIIIGVVNFRVWLMRYNLQTTIYRIGNKVGRVDEKINIAKLTRFEILNGILIILTLGIGTPFVAIRRMQMYTSLVSFLAPFDFDNVVQTGKEYNDAFGEDLGDQFDIQLDLM